MKPHICILIPAYNPDHKLLVLINELQENESLKLNFASVQIVIINDGSFKKESLSSLKKVGLIQGVQLIDHPKNLGKGAAIKTGLKFVSQSKISYIVTADSDGQHLADDIFRVLNQSIKSDKFVLGTRSFSSDSVPLKSKIGNLATRSILSIFTGIKLEDTQTGLRAFPKRLVQSLLKIEEDRYDYEFNCLVSLSKKEDFLSVPIRTIYFDNNAKSSFRPIYDSFLIYFVFFRYSTTAMCVGIADFVIIYFAVIFFPVTYSFLTVRLFSAHIYFYLMKTTVFKTEGKLAKELFLYYISLLVNVLITWSLFDYFFFSSDSSFIFSYFFGIFLMFVINFFIQKHIIFKG